MRYIFSKVTTVILLHLQNILVFGSSPPNIIIIVADDLGFNDVGFHGSTQIPTPNIDALAYSGIILQNYYVQPICTPSRSALLTGAQHSVIFNGEPWGVSDDHMLLSQNLGEYGYIPHCIGKWHLGYCKKELTPLSRGFKSHFGYWGGHEDYYNHTATTGPGYWGYDMRRNMTVAHDVYGKYTTDLFTDEAVDVIMKHNSSQPLFLYLAHLAVHSGNPYAPLQAPKEIVEKFSYIADENRRKFAGMLWKLDESVGRVMEALDAQQMLHNSIILFTTDNGGPAAGFNANAASNWPLRGVKAAIWEGGVRGAGFLWSPFIQNPGRIAQQMVHITDWVPTLISAAGGDVSALDNVDGIDQWPALALDLPSVRKEFLLNIDPILDGAGVRVGDWKLVYNPQGYGAQWDRWFGPTGRNETAPETQLDVIIEQVLNSSAAAVILKAMPNAYQNIRSLREGAMIHCDPIPKNATQSCNSRKNPCLFHIPSDPCEYHNVAKLYPDIVMIAKILLEKHNKTAVPPANKPFDPAANPKYWGYAWTNWLDYPQPHIDTTDRKEFKRDIYGDIRTD